MALLVFICLTAAPSPAAPCLATGAAAEAIAATGCYADAARQVPAPALIAYDVNAPLWTDGTIKRRYLRLPPGARARLGEGGVLELPVGSVIVKEFRLPALGGRAERPLETRLMLHTEAGWHFATYAWDEAGTGARLLAGGATREVEVPRAGRIVYRFPSEQECRACHSAGGEAEPLALTLAQLVRPGAGAAFLKARGVLADDPSASVARNDLLPDPRDSRAPLARRARAWLHANCAHCHRPGGWAPPTLTLDLRFDRSLGDTHTCREDTQYFTIGPRIDPGRPDRSQLWRRIRSRGDAHMPPLGVATEDPDAVIVRDWIASLADCRE